MNTLTGIEAERVNQILKHALDRLQILQYVPTTWDDDIIAELRCPPVVSALEKTWMAEEQLRTMGESGVGEMGGGKEIALIKMAHKSTRASCRHLQADRDSLQVLMNRAEQPQTSSSSAGGGGGGGGEAEGGGRNGNGGGGNGACSEEFGKFIRYLNDMRSQVHSKMTTTVEDEAANRALLHDLTERERLMEETRDNLQAKLNEVREEKDRVTFSLDQTLRKLQLELQDINALNSAELESVQKEMTDAIAKATTEHEMRMRQLQDQVDGFERSSTEVMDRNKEEEGRLRKDKGRAESALNAKIAQYDEGVCVCVCVCVCACACIFIPSLSFHSAYRNTYTHT